jgi:IS4 transposase
MKTVTVVVEGRMFTSYEVEVPADTDPADLDVFTVVREGFVVGQQYDGPDRITEVTQG